MNLLVTKVPALIFPYARQQEQPMRAEKIKKYLPVAVLTEQDMQPDSLSRHMVQMLQRKEFTAALPLNLDGAANAARFLNQFCSA
jgi:predicted glycosyltransferase